MKSHRTNAGYGSNWTFLGKNMFQPSQMIVQITMIIKNPIVPTSSVIQRATRSVRVNRSLFSILTLRADVFVFDDGLSLFLFTQSLPLLFVNSTDNRYCYARMFTARAATKPTVSTDALDSIIKRSLTLALSGIVSVGENAVAFVKDTKK